MNSHERTLEAVWCSISTRYLLCSFGMQWTWVITYHPGLAAEVVDRVEGVDGVDATILEADDEAAEVLS